MDKQHYNELVLLSQEIYDHASDKLTNSPQYSLSASEFLPR